MNRFDRVTSLLLLLQTRSVVTAGFLSEHFGVTERTIYRDIRTLENAGVPIGSEAGVGYFLEKGYRLPPVSFTLDEAASLLLGEKLLSATLDKDSHEDYRYALNKVRAVLDRSDKDYLSSLDADTEVQSFITRNTDETGDRWLRECRRVLVQRQIVTLTYIAQGAAPATTRDVEPIGLFHYSRHWHLIGWCRLRQDYRDFRLDRISSFDPSHEQFPRHRRDNLQDYLARQQTEHDLTEVVIVFDPMVTRFIGEVKYLHGFVREEFTEEGLEMVFLCSRIEYLARWLVQFTSGVEVKQCDQLRHELAALSAELVAHWSDSNQG